MRKIVVSLLMGILLCIFLTSCGIPKPPNEKQIAEEFPDEITTIIIENPFDATNLDVYEMNIEELSIEKRQTNEKNDVAYCIVELANEYYHFTKYVRLNYNYYDQGGWILDGWDYYNDMAYQVLVDPFGEDCAALKWSYEYANVNVENATLNIDQNSIVYELRVGTMHQNATIRGKLIDTYIFNGIQWVEYTDTSGINTEWEIVGNWEYIVKSTSNSFVFGCTMVIDSFDQDAASASGVCEFFYTELSPIRLQVEQRSYQRDFSDAQILCSKESVRIEWLMDSIQIDLDNASGEFYDGWGNRSKIPELYRVFETESNPPDTSGTVNNYITSDEDEVIWNKLISEYFDVMETSNEDQILNYTIESGPYGDDINVRGEHLKKYEIIKVEHSNEFYAGIHDSLEREIELVKSMFAEYKPDLNIVMTDYAEAYVQAQFESQDLETIDYKFCFIKNSGTWEIFYVDNAF